MIYLVIRGACGNQFFQYAFARNLQERIGGELVIDYSAVKGVPGIWEGSDNLLADFNTVPYRYVDKPSLKVKFFFRVMGVIRRIFHLRDFEKRTYRFLLFLARFFERFGLYYFDSAYFPYKYYNNKNVFINGYYESPQYFKEMDDKICSELTPRHPLLEQNKELFNIICTRPSVCITIKRQDVENPDISEIYQYDMNYFYNAVKYIREREPEAVYIIFSDNVDWCRENFQIEEEVYYETSGNPIWEKIRLMASCKHFIIHNSTFSWWVQHLGRREGKIVIAPVKWMLRDDQPIDIYEDNWIYMRNDGIIQETHD